MNNDYSLSHTKRECKYYLTWIPKYRKKQLYGELRKYLGEILKEPALRRKCEILEGHLMPDHAHRQAQTGKNGFGKRIKNNLRMTLSDSLL